MVLQITIIIIIIILFLTCMVRHWHVHNSIFEELKYDFFNLKIDFLLKINKLEKEAIKLTKPNGKRFRRALTIILILHFDLDNFYPIIHWHVA